METKLICKYFGIYQLNQMFDEDYFNFEWDMHVGHNLQEHRSDYYRDHFVHQIRNLYMMLTLLEKVGFYEASEHILRIPKASKVSEFVYKKSMVFRTDEMGAEQQSLKLILKDYQEHYHDEYALEFTKYNLVNGEIDLNSDKAIPLIFEGTPFASFPIFLDAYFYKYVIYASTILSALFHDMGYPICHFLSVRRRISEYNPAMYMFTHNAVESFDQLAFKLGSSLLFSIVSPEIVRKRLEPRKKGGYDHGAYSAIAFLLQFYDTGVIYSLSAEKQCAIEIAALAIFNHTSKFQIINEKEDTRYYNMVFRQNPISFLLRFCDDLQEWDRRYFEISETSDLLFCPKCGLPLLKHLKYREDGTPHNYSEYRCGCMGLKLRPELRRPDVFIKRKLYLVTVADWVRFHFENQNGEKRNLIATINYDLYKLLLMAKTNNDYASFRMKELGEVKKLLSNQDFSFMSDGILSFSRICLEYSMTLNPLLIKIWILERYIRRTKWLTGSSELLEEEMDLSLLSSKLERAYMKRSSRKRYEYKLINSVLGQDENNTNKTEDENNKRVRTALRNHLLDTTTKNGALGFYLILLHDCLSKNDKMSNELLAYISPYQTIDPMYYEIMCCFIRDCFRQYASSCRDIKSYFQEGTEPAFHLNVSRYTDTHNFFNSYEAEPIALDGSGIKYPYIGYFRDIYLFYLMNEAVNHASKK